MIPLNLIHNIALLVALMALYQLMMRRWRHSDSASQIISGFLYGAVGVVGMMTPVQYAPGIIYDGRSIILSVAGYFGGPIVAVIAGTICAVYRMFLGGAGTMAGIATILLAASVGTAFYYFRRWDPRTTHLLSLWGFGLVVHIGMLAIQYWLLPGGAGLEVVRQIGLAILILYPATTVLICKLFFLFEEQRRSEAALHESEAKYRTLVDNIPVSVFLKDKNSRFVSVNNQFANLHGVHPEEMIGKTDYDFFPKEYADTYRTNDQRIIDSSEPIEMEEIHFQENQEKWVQVVKTPVRDDHGRVIGLLGIFWDITQRKQAEAALKHSYDVMRYIIEHDRSAIAVFDRDLKYIYVSQRYIEDYKLNETDLVGKHHYEVFPEIPQRWKEIHRKALSGEILSEENDPFIRQDGSVDWTRWECRPWYEANGSIGGIILYSEVITERKQAEGALRESEKIYRSLFENHSAVKLIIDPETWEIADANEAAAAFYGWSIERLRQMKISDINTLSPEKLRVEMAKAKANKNIHFEFQHRRADGSIRDVAVFTSKIDIKGRTYLHSIIHDITEQKQAEQALRKSESLLRIACDLAQMGGWSINLADNRVVWSEEVAAIHDMNVDYYPTVEEGIAFYAPEYRDRITKVYTDCVREGIPYDEELEIITAKGRRVWVRTIGTAERDPSGEIIGVLGAFQDITNRKQAEQALRSSEEKHRLLFDHAAEAIFVAQNGRLRYGNANVETITGYTLEYLMSRPFHEFIHPEDREMVLNRHQKRLQGEDNASSYQFRILPSNGMTRWVELKAVYIEWEGKPATLNFITDVTERKQAEEALRESEALLREMGRIAKIGAWEFNPESGEGSWTDEVSRIHELNPDEVTSFERGMSFYQGESRAEIEKAVKQAITEGREYDLELELITAKGNHKWVRTIGQPVIENGNVVQVRGSFQDITSRKSIEEKLRKLSQAVEQSPTSVIITDLAGDIEYVNPQFTKVTGYSPEDVVGKNPRILKSDETPPEVYKELWETITSGIEWRGELLNKRKDGSLFWERAAISPIHDDSGKITHYLAVKEDITEEKSLQAQLIQAQKLETVGRLAGGVAHDFNNMLCVIIGYAQMSLEQLNEDDVLHHFVTEILNAAKRSSNITQQLLAFARKQTISPKILDLNQTVADMLKMLHRLISEDIQLKWHPGAEPWLVRIDPAQVDQILVNLVINSRDAIHDVGTITIETKNAMFDEEYCSQHSEFIPGQYVMLSVSDDGCGMDKESLEKIFEPFFTTKAISEGTGLGLSTVYGIVKQNSGFINVYSEPGHGSVFRIYFPRIQTDAIPELKANINKPHQHGVETILVIEDEEAILKLAQSILIETGYSVLTAQSPEEAIRLVENYEKDIHLLITDMVMPGMNGKELANRLEAIKPGMKRIYMSGYTSNVIAHHGVLEEGIHFLQKPFSLIALTDMVRDVLDA